MATIVQALTSPLKLLSSPSFWGVILAVYGSQWLLRRVRQHLRARKLPRYLLHDLRLPFEGEWHTYWGGDRARLNHHFGSTAQHYAFDFVIPVATPKPKILGDIASEPLTYLNEGKANEDYPCYGAPILAPHSGIVVCAVDGISDNSPSECNEQMVYGNTIMIQHPESGFISVLAHLKKQSLCVKEGDSVTAGQPIALCGNSGNSSEPHLHFHVQSKPGFEQGEGVKVFFSALTKQSKGTQRNYSPIKGESVQHLAFESIPAEN